MEHKKKMKIIARLVLVFSLGSLEPVFSQADILQNPDYGPDSTSRLECANNLSTMSEFMKIDLVNYALPSWLAVFDNCPASSKNIYLYGVKIFHKRLANEKDQVRRKELLDSLMLIYDRRIEYFGQKGRVLGRKGIDLLRYDQNAIDEAHKILGESIKASGQDAEEAVIVTFMQTSTILFKADQIESKQVIDDYMEATGILSKRIRSGNQDRTTEKALDNVDMLLAESGAGDCMELVGIFTPKFRSDPGNTELLKTITTVLMRRGCEDSELFAKASEKLYEIEPTSDAAYNLAKLFLKREEYKKALEYYNKAIKSSDDQESKAQYNYQAAVLLLNKFENYPESRSYALRAIDLKSGWGAPYILIGNAYAASSKQCGENDFDRSTVYWAAVDKYIEAKSIDPTVTEEANSLIERFSKYFPNVEDAFFYGYQEGQDYKVGCWINEDTKVRTRK